MDQDTFKMVKYHETKIDKGASEIVSFKKILACSLKKIAPRYFPDYCILLFL